MSPNRINSQAHMHMIMAEQGVMSRANKAVGFYSLGEKGAIKVIYRHCSTLQNE